MSDTERSTGADGGLAAAIRQRAYALWEQEGRPTGREFEHWQRAQAEIALERAAEVREAGPQAMQSPPDDWTMVDQESDESFPASDPPGNY